MIRIVIYIILFFILTFYLKLSYNKNISALINAIIFGIIMYFIGNNKEGIRLYKDAQCADMSKSISPKSEYELSLNNFRYYFKHKSNGNCSTYPFDGIYSDAACTKINTTKLPGSFADGYVKQNIPRTTTYGYNNQHTRTKYYHECHKKSML